MVDKYIVFSIFSDLFVNLSAGWLGAIIVIPIIGGRRGKLKVLALIFNFILAILSLGISYKFRMLSQR